MASTKAALTEICGRINDVSEAIGDLVALINKLKKAAKAFLALAVLAALSCLLPWNCGGAVVLALIFLLIAGLLWVLAWALEAPVAKLRETLKRLTADKANLISTLADAAASAKLICPMECHSRFNDNPPC